MLRVGMNTIGNVDKYINKVSISLISLFVYVLCIIHINIYNLISFNSTHMVRFTSCDRLISFFESHEYVAAQLHERRGRTTVSPNDRVGVFE